MTSSIPQSLTFAMVNGVYPSNFILSYCILNSKPSYMTSSIPQSLTIAMVNGVYPSNSILSQCILNSKSSYMTSSIPQSLTIAMVNGVYASIFHLISQNLLLLQCDYEQCFNIKTQHSSTSNNICVPLVYPKF